MTKRGTRASVAGRVSPCWPWARRFTRQASSRLRPRAEAERSPGAGDGRRAWLSADLRRQDPDGMGRKPTYWRAENGALVGEITPETVIKSNTFIIWRGGRPKDFDLKLDYRITAAGNSGINYRSAQVPDPVTPPTSSR